jgi:probable HAF family extracellular repeat protein
MNPNRALALLACVFVASSAFSQSYSARSYIADGQSAVLTGLNNHGQVVGYSGTGVNLRGFVSAPNAGELSYFTSVVGDSAVRVERPVAINDNGMVVGSATAWFNFRSSSGYTYKDPIAWAFIAGPDLVAQTLGVNPPDQSYLSYSYRPLIAIDINAQGKALVVNSELSAGAYSSLAQPSAAGKYTLSGLGNFFGEIPSNPTANTPVRLNDNGEILVHTTKYSSNTAADDAVVSADLKSSRTVLPNALEYTFSKSINSAGQIVGSYSTQSVSPTSQRAFFLESTGQSVFRQLLGFSPTGNSSALDINDQGQVVGWAQDSNGVSRAFVTGNQGVGFTDLNTLVTLSQGEILVSASKINEVGQILAQSNLGTHYFLNPSAVPEPGTIGLMSMGLLAVSFMRRKSIKV